MIEIECNAKGFGCGRRFIADETKITEEYIQCPFCGKISKNPFYEDEDKRIL